MIDLPLAHVGGIPIEETIGSFGPALVVGIGVAWAKLRDRLRHPPALKRPGPEAGPGRAAGSKADTTRSPPDATAG
jgi:hypothetical protein